MPDSSQSSYLSVRKSRYSLLRCYRLFSSLLNQPESDREDGYKTLRWVMFHKNSNANVQPVLKSLPLQKSASEHTVHKILLQHRNSIGLRPEDLRESGLLGIIVVGDKQGSFILCYKSSFVHSVEKNQQRRTVNSPGHTLQQQFVCCELTFNLDVTQMPQEECETLWPWESANPHYTERR